jgi:hypothetical protein
LRRTSFAVNALASNHPIRMEQQAALMRVGFL